MTPEQMTREEYHLHLEKLRSSGRYVFAYKLSEDEILTLSRDQQKARIAVHASRCLDNFFDNMPK